MSYFRRRNSKIQWLLISAILCLSGVITQAQTPKAPLEVPLSLSYQNYDASAFLADVATAAHVPIGFEGMRRSRGLISISTEWAPLHDVLDDVVRQLGDYSWTFSDGSVHIRPRHSDLPMLDLQIKAFVVSNDSAPDLQEAVFELPEIKEAMKQGNLKSQVVVSDDDEPTGGFSHVASDKWRGREGYNLPFTLSSITLRKMLNDLLSKGVIDYWFVGFGRDGANYVDITFH